MKRSWPKVRYYPGTCLEQLRKTTKISARIVGVPVEIRIGYLPNKSQKKPCN
jgi:hypothetical protein